MASKTSSCWSHERSFSIFLLFVGVKSSIKIPHVRYFSFGFKAKKLRRFPYRFLPCVMVRLGLKGTTRLIQMRIGVSWRWLFPRLKILKDNLISLWVCSCVVPLESLSTYYQTCLSLCLYIFMALFIKFPLDLHIEFLMLLLSLYQVKIMNEK